MRARFCIMRARSKSLTRNTIVLHNCGASCIILLIPHRTRECYMYNNRRYIAHKVLLKGQCYSPGVMQAANLRA